MTQRPPISRTPPPPPPDDEEEEESPLHSTTSVISAQGLFRLILIILTVWTLFEGFALATGAFSAVDAGSDRTAERMLGGMMIVLGGVYAMLAWQRERYRLLLWVPFAAQAAIVAPLLFSFDADRLLLLVISSLFLVLMVYVWWRSREIDDLDEDEWDEEGEEEDDDTYLAHLDEEDELPAPKPRTATARGARASTIEAPPSRDPARRPGRFRKRDS